MTGETPKTCDVCDSALPADWPSDVARAEGDEGVRIAVDHELCASCVEFWLHPPGPSWHCACGASKHADDEACDECALAMDRIDFEAVVKSAGFALLDYDDEATALWFFRGSAFLADRAGPDGRDLFESLMAVASALRPQIPEARIRDALESAFRGDIWPIPPGAEPKEGSPS